MSFAVRHMAFRRKKWRLKTTVRSPAKNFLKNLETRPPRAHLLRMQTATVCERRGSEVKLLGGKKKSLWQSMRLDSHWGHNHGSLSSGGGRNYGDNTLYYVTASLAFQLRRGLSATQRHVWLLYVLIRSPNWEAGYGKAWHQSDPEWDVWETSRVMQLGTP